MNIAILLMAGNGTRMNSDIPKQYIEINNKPIFLYTIDKFINENEINKIILVISEKWEELVINKINLLPNIKKKKIDIIYGGATRNDSITNAIKHCNRILGKNYNDALILTHDVARPLVSNEIISNCISILKNNPNCVVNTSIKLNDTISFWKKDKLIKFINRDKVYIHQTPQCSNLNTMNKICSYIDKKKLNSTDIVCIAKKLKIKIINVNGDIKNFKITTSQDIDLLKSIIKK